MMEENIVSIVQLVLNLLFGGGFIVTLVTLKSERKKAKETARGAELDNIERATDILMRNIVTPLKEELNALRNETRKLRKAINKANSCTHSDNCPVLDVLRNDTKHQDQEQGRNDTD